MNRDYQKTTGATHSGDYSKPKVSFISSLLIECTQGDKIRQFIYVYSQKDSVKGDGLIIVLYQPFIADFTVGGQV